MIQRLLLLTGFLLIQTLSYAHMNGIFGIVWDEQENTALPGATLKLMNPETKQPVKLAVSDDAGRFRILGVEEGKYSLEISFIGFVTKKIPVTIAKEPIRIGKIALSHNQKVTDSVIIEGKLNTGTQKGDTSEFNAGAFKVNKDATSEDLITKMPGVTIQDGKINAQGEEVRKVLVDGKPFFGDDPSAVLKNLPAEIIDKVQVYDKWSEQSEFTGVFDGNTTKTINLITKKDRRKAIFGKVYGGYGTDDRYQAATVLNRFNGNQRITLLGMSNNINQQNFSMQDILGVMTSGNRTGGGGRGRGMMGGGGGMFGGGMGGFNMGNFFVGQQSGINTTHSVGLNYSDVLSQKLSISGNYFFNLTQNNNNQSSFREYFLNADTNQTNSETNNNNSNNHNHRFNLKIDYKIDSLRSLTISPRGSFQDNSSSSDIISQSFFGTRRLNQTTNETKNDNLGYNLGSDYIFRNKFMKHGRNLSLEGSFTTNRKDGESYLNAQNLFGDFNPLLQTQDQLTNSYTYGQTLNNTLSYTEPLDSFNFISASLKANINNNETERLTYQYDSDNGAYNILSTNLSNVFQNQYLTNRAGLAYNYSKKTKSFTLGLDYQIANLTGESQFPNEGKVNRSFKNILPISTFNYQFPNKTNIRIIYRTSTQAPSINQMQTVLNNNNPLALSIGNANLDQTYTHQFIFRTNRANPTKSTNLFAMINANYTDGYIGNATFIPSEQTVINGVSLQRGTQLSMPVNFPYQVSTNTMWGFGFPLKQFKSNINIHLGGNFQLTPSSINEVTNYAQNTGIFSGVTIGSNISEKLDFTVSYSGTKTFVTNSIQKNLNNDYFFHNATLKLNWIFFKDFFIQTDVTNTYYTGLGEGFNQNFFLAGASVGTKFLKGKSAEIKLTGYDLLKQNVGVGRSVSETYIEDSRSSVLTRYFMLTFTYNIRKFQVDKSMLPPGMQNMPMPPMHMMPRPQ